MHYICKQIPFIMQQATISIRVDQSLKKKFDSLCEAFGLSTTAAFNIFMKAIVRESKIPFEIRADKEELTRTKAIDAFNELRQAAATNMPDMSLDEINAEINASRIARK